MYYVARIIAAHIRFHSVVVSTLDFESNNTSSNLVGSTRFQIFIIVKNL